MGIAFSETKIIQDRYRIVGREEELEVALAASHAGKHMLLEGAVGVGKTVIAMALSEHLNRCFYRIDGDERYTEQKLTGWFDPPSVMSKGFSWETFISGPLTQAMVEGALLFINELNRMPEGTQNVLLPAMDEQQITIPKLGVIKAKPGFLVIATQNPEEFVGTSRLGEALKDRFVWIRLNYQSEDEERKIVHKETGCNDELLISVAVKIVRMTREEARIRRGASVRGAIDIVDIIRRLDGGATNQTAWVKAALLALATKIELQSQADQSTETIITNIVNTVLKDQVETSSHEIVSNETNREDFSVKNNSKIKGTPHNALKNGILESLTSLSIQNPETIDDILLKQGLFDKVIKASEHAESIWPAIRLVSLAQECSDPTSKRMARRTLIRIIARFAAQMTWRGIGPTQYDYVPFKPGLDEFDIEQTCENRLGKDYLDYEDIVSIQRSRRKGAVVLMLDVSNSMKREKVIIAAVTVAVLAHKLRDEPYSVIVFRDHPRIIKPIEENLGVETLIDRILDLQSGGSTNIEEALRKGLDELDKLQHIRVLRERYGILITDGWATVGGDPVKIAKKYLKLHVIRVPLGLGGGDPVMCENIAKAGHGKHSHVREFEELPQAIMSVFR